MKKKKLAASFLNAAGMFFFSGVFVLFGNLSGVANMAPNAYAQDDEESESEDESEDRDKKEKTEQEKKRKEEKKILERQQEKEKRANEFQRESEKKVLEIKKESEKRQAELLKKAHERKMEVEKEGEMDAKDDADSNEKMREEEKRRFERRAYAREKIAEAEQYITEQQSEGKDVSIALERLTQAKKMLEATENAAKRSGEQDNDDLDDFVKESLKLARKAEKEDIHSLKDFEKRIEKASHRIDQAKEKLSRLAAVGGDAQVYQSGIDAAVSDLKTARQMLANGSLLEGAALAKKAELEAKSVKKSIEAALLALGIGDDDLSGDHKSVVAEAVEDLLFLSHLEGESKGLGEQIRKIAREQRDAGQNADNLVDAVQSRSKFSEFLFGPKYDKLNDLQKQTSENQKRIQSLSQIKESLEDEDSKSLVQEHITALAEENTKLQNFVAGKELRRGLFGWVFRLLQ